MISFIKGLAIQNSWALKPLFLNLLRIGGLQNKEILEFLKSVVVKARGLIDSSTYQRWQVVLDLSIITNRLISRDHFADDEEEFCIDVGCRLNEYFFDDLHFIAVENIYLFKQINWCMMVFPQLQAKFPDIPFGVEDRDIKLDLQSMDLEFQKSFAPLKTHVIQYQNLARVYHSQLDLKEAVRYYRLSVNIEQSISRKNRYQHISGMLDMMVLNGFLDEESYQKTARNLQKLKNPIILVEPARSL